MNTSNREQAEAMASELGCLRAQATESEALITFLRNRTVLLDNEIQHRDNIILERDRQIATLTQHLAEASPADTEA